MVPRRSGWACCVGVKTIRPILTIAFWTGCVLFALGRFITFYPGIETAWFAASTGLCSCGFLLRSWRYSVSAGFFVAAGIVLSVLGLRHGQPYQAWLKQQPSKEEQIQHVGEQLQMVDDAKAGPQATAPAGSHWEPFRMIPPVADANPSVRHAVPVRLPTAMVVVRKGDSLTVSFPALATTNLMVGHKMVTGIKREDSVLYDGVAHPRGMSLEGGLAFEQSTNVFILGRDGLPKSGQDFTMEHRVTAFETDVPAQHMWSLESGKHYRVLWTRTFRQTVR